MILAEVPGVAREISKHSSKMLSFVTLGFSQKNVRQFWPATVNIYAKYIDI